MHKVLLAAALAVFALPALAADLTTKAPAYAAPAYNWSGFYAGLNAGYARGAVSVTDTNGGVNPGPFGYKTNGGLGGGQIGYNYTYRNFLIGIEGDLDYLGNSGSGIIQSANAAAHQNLTLGNGVLADVTGRLGYTVGPVLIYAKGGGAWFSGSAAQATTNPGYVTTGTGVWSGYTYGAGVEYLLTQNVSLKGEYQHFDFGSLGGYQTNVGDVSSPIGYKFQNTTSLRFDVAKVGVNYRF